jgi:osmoprotectant transport system ATP-binding protein
MLCRKGLDMSVGIVFRAVSFEVAQGRVVLRDISLAIERGTTTAILGRSGSGKSTLLRTVNRLIEPTRGEVLIDGKNANELDLIALRRGMGYVIQDSGLFPHFTVERNVGLVLEAEGRPRREREERSRELLLKVGLDPGEYAARFPHQLSGGQRQRVGVARALAAEPATLLMDEPFGALDPLTRAEMQEMMLDLLRGLKKTVLLVTHDLDEALYLADRIVLLSDGQVAADLATEQFTRSTEPAVQDYVRAFHRGDARQERA